MTATAADIQLFPFTLYGVTIFFINPTEFPVILTEKKIILDFTRKPKHLNHRQTEVVKTVFLIRNFCCILLSV